MLSSCQFSVTKKQIDNSVLTEKRLDKTKKAIEITLLRYCNLIHLQEKATEYQFKLKATYQNSPVWRRSLSLPLEIHYKHFCFEE